MRVVQTKFPKGKVVRDRYMVEELLGQGGFGAVYRVRDRRVRGNVFALKEVVNPTSYQRESFAFECDVLRRLDHYALPRVYRVFEDNKNNRVYMLMDYVEGPNLERLRQLQVERRFSLSQVMKMMLPIIEAVTYLHAQQPPIIHRDIKPSNIIAPTSGDPAVLVDFGIAKEYDQDSTTTAVRHCSPGYGAPEQYMSGTSTQTDIYGLGATFYTLLTGEVPIDALYRITRLSGKGIDPLLLANERVPEIPVAVAEALQRAMAVNSNDRFPTVEEFWAALLPYYPVKTPITDPVGIPTTDPLNGPAMLEEQALIAEEQPELERVIEETVPSAPDTPAGLSLIPSDTPVSLPIKRPLTRDRHLLFSTLVAIALIAVVAGVVFGSGAWSGLKHANQPRHTAQPRPGSAHATTLPVAKATPSASAPSPTPQLTATPAPPSLLTNYSGVIHNTPAEVDSSLSLTQMHQDGEDITGYLTLGPGLLGDGNFAGKLTSDKKIQFLVPSHSKFLPLLFQGQVQADGSISGTYCGAQNGQCSYNEGYGTWKVSPLVKSGDPALSDGLPNPATHTDRKDP